MSTQIVVVFVLFQSWMGHALQMEVEREATMELARTGGFAIRKSMLCFPLDLIASKFESRLFDRVSQMMMAECAVDDRQLSLVAKFDHLRSLFLEHTPVTNDLLKHLSGQTELRELSLGNTRIDNEGLRSLAALTNLHSLWIDRTRVSDESIEVLIGFTQLHHLDIRQTKISSDGVARIRKALPECVIHR